ncbi:SDR family NAD(P)-dependent oxidoreductase [Intestinibacter sp.]
MYPIYKKLSTREECEQVKVLFPPQHQECQPGIENIMVPRPISNNPSYVGSGKLKGKVAIITGGDSGIGRAIAYIFVKEGADVVISYLNEHDDANETKACIEKIGGKCLLIPGDLKEESMSKVIVEKTIECFGKIDILVNNHAVQFIQRSILDIIAEQLDFTFRTNIYPFFYLTKAVLPCLKKGASIINTASITAYRGEPLLIDYSATKGAVVAFTYSNEELTNVVEIHFIEIPKLEDGTDEKDMLVNWIEFLKDPESETVRSLEMSIEEIRQAKDELVKMSNDDAQRELYEMRAKTLRDEVSTLNNAERKGIKKGREEGRKQGIQEGEKKKAVEIAKSLLDILDVDTISLKTGLSKDEINNLK